MAHAEKLTSRVQDVEKQLAKEFGEVLPREVIERTMAQCLDEYRDASVSDFVPLFVHRQARQRLAELAAGAHRALAS